MALCSEDRVLLSRHHEGCSRSGRYCLQQRQASLGEAHGPTSHPSRPTLFLLLGSCRSGPSEESAVEDGGGDEEEKVDGSTQGDSCGAAAHRGRRHHLPCWRLRRHPSTPLNRLFSKPPHPKIFTWGSECLSR